MQTQSMTIEIWSDVVCPWCYIGEHRFEAALARFAHQDAVDIVWRSFELDSTTPRDSKQTTVEMLSSKYGISRAEALRKEQQLSELAAAEGLVLRPDRSIANTFDAHRLLHLAAAHGLQAALSQRLFAANFAEQERISDHDTLIRLATEVGLDPAEARRVLESDAYTAEVHADQRRGAALGIRGVPFFVIDERYGVSGAQTPEVLLDALNQAWAEAHPLTLIQPATAEADNCDDGSCAVTPAEGAVQQS